MSSSKKLTLKGLWGRCLFVWGPLPSGVFVSGWFSNFVGSESDQIQIMDSNIYLKTPPHLLPATHCLYDILYFDTGKGEGEELNQGEG